MLSLDLQEAKYQYLQKVNDAYKMEAINRLQETFDQMEHDLRTKQKMMLEEEIERLKKLEAFQ